MLSLAFDRAKFLEVTSFNSTVWFFVLWEMSQANKINECGHLSLNPTATGKRLFEFWWAAPSSGLPYCSSYFYPFYLVPESVCNYSWPGRLHAHWTSTLVQSIDGHWGEVPLQEPKEQQPSRTFKGSVDQWRQLSICLPLEDRLDMEVRPTDKEVIGIHCIPCIGDPVLDLVMLLLMIIA